MVWHIGKCPRCQAEMDSKGLSVGDFFLAWVFKVAWWLKREYPTTTLIMWDDMMRNVPAERLKSSGVTEIVEPMVWQYQDKTFDLPSDLFEKYSSIFPSIWVASAFKGATGSTQFLPPIQHHISNNLTWLSLMAEKKQIKKFKGICLTGWQRYDHYAVLCELLPVALPSLCLCLRVASQGTFTEADHDLVSQKMGFKHRINVLPFPRPKVVEQQMSFPGHKVYVGVQMWSNFVCRYQAISNSEGMLGWFSDYLRSRNFTNPVQVEIILTQMVELLNNILELKAQLEVWLGEVFFEGTVEEWVGCFVDPLVEKLNGVIKECKKQILIGGRVRDYKKAQVC
ncbi:Hexosaminidase D [Chionoecetes opilio]|uniref:Hexosaminidase D n=1 Tax=Chionoecetes opilio TaxID=41210 RepID=A0A8J4YBN7_CHIOP|nr:Hexosaminidase D [Chionoecetes opilio]